MTALILTFCSLTLALGSDVAPAPRLLFADALLSVTFPEGWSLEKAFPVGPMFSKNGALITCEASVVEKSITMKTQWPYEDLERFATWHLEHQAPSAKVLSMTRTRLAERNAVDVTWQDASRTPPVQILSEYFYAQDRMYSLSLETTADRFAALVPEFQAWLASLRLLSYKDGTLTTPARGALWLHQTGGLKLWIPDHWLLGVSTARNMGAGIVVDEKQGQVTAAFDPALQTAVIGEDERAQARETILKGGYRLRSESSEPFKGLPAFHLQYDGRRGERVIRAEDIWIASPKGRWLISLEADSTLFGKLTDDFRQILNDAQFF